MNTSEKDMKIHIVIELIDKNIADAKKRKEFKTRFIRLL